MNETCRVCLRKSADIIKNISDYIEIIRKISQIDVILNEDFPNKVCNDCANDLENANMLHEMLLDCNKRIWNDIDSMVMKLEVGETEQFELNYNEKEPQIGVDNFSIEIKTEPTHECPSTKNHEISTSRRAQVTLRESKKLKLTENVTLKSQQSEKLSVAPLSRACPPVTFPCYYCQSEEINLKFHMQTIHPDLPLEYRCALCHNTYKTFDALKQHMNSICRKEKKYICDECGSAFRLPCRLKRHIKVAHDDTRNFTCDICKGTFKTIVALKLHMRSHTKEKPYKCKFCTKAYSHYSDWKTHHLTHTNEWRYYCLICNKGFYKPSALKIHQKLH
uniref:CSON014661 protein n=1 Tax=Culicoides sonorensis TaxID=179676 RepID=A0A336MGX3_CULSO